MNRVATSLVWVLAAWAAAPMGWPVRCVAALAVAAGPAAAAMRARRLRPVHAMLIGAAGAVAAAGVTLLEGGAMARDPWLAVLFGAGAPAAFVPRREGRSGPAWAELLLAGAAFAAGATPPGGASAVPALMLALPAAAVAALAAETGRTPWRAVVAMAAGCIGIASFLYIVHPIPAHVTAWFEGGSEGPVVPAGRVEEGERDWLVGSPEAPPDLADLTVFGWVLLEGGPLPDALYMRQRAYPRYIGATRWDFDPTREALPSRPDGWTVLGPGIARRTRRLEGFVDWLRPSVMYLLPGEPVRVSHPGLFRLPDGQVFPDSSQVVIQYRFVADWVDPAEPGLDAIRAIGPGETLDFPPGLEPLKEFVEEVTRGSTSRAEQARRLCAHVRDRFEYVLEPAGSYIDVLESRRGYCGSLAGMCALALRSQGISTRVAVGVRTDDIAGGWYAVRARHAHAWVEAYFGEYGWVAFDPSPEASAIAPPVPPEARPPERGNEGEAPPVRGTGTVVPPWMSYATLAVAAAAALLAWLMRRRGEAVRGFVRRFRAARTPMGLLDRFLAAAARRGARIRSGETPARFAARAPEAWRGAAREIVAIYYEVRYGGRPFDGSRRARAAALLKAL